MVDQVQELEQEKHALLARVKELEDQLDRQSGLRSSNENLASELSDSEENFLFNIFEKPLTELQINGQRTGINPKVLKILQEIQNLPPPELARPIYNRMTPRELREENQRRFRFRHLERPGVYNAATGRSLDLPGTILAPSIRVDPLPLTAMPSFTTVLQELGVLPLTNVTDGTTPLYFADCRILSQNLFKKIVITRAEHLVKMLESKKINKGTQTFITHVGKQHSAGCVNCKSKDHTFKNCQLPFRPGFCKVCGAEGFDEEDCIYPHGIEHEIALGRCPGCTRDLSLYCPECPDCNIRYEGLVDWLRLNYSTWPTWMIPTDHRYLVNEGEGTLTKRIKIKFDNQRDRPNQIRAFLVRENALLSVATFNPTVERTVHALSEEKRRFAVKALQTPLTNKTLDQIFRERPELSDGEVIKVITPTAYKKQ